MRPLASTPETTAELNRRLRSAGVLILASYVVLLSLSFGIAAVSPFGGQQVREVEWFHALINGGWLPWPMVAAWLTRVASGDSILATLWVRTVAGMTPLTIATCGAVFSTLLLSRSRHLIDGSTVTLILKMAVAFGVTSALTYPMYTQDVWMSVVWGRMLLAGHNPYYEFFTPRALAGTPLVDFPLKMTYGPLWAWVSVLIAAGGRGHAVVELVLSKLLLLSCWLSCLWLLRAILADAPPVHQAGALCFFGWWPVSIRFSLAEGHNDIALVCLLLLWLYHSERRWRSASILPLVASVLVKYVTAPLVVLELWRGWMVDKRSRRALVAAIAVTGVAVVLVMSPLWRDAHFFDPVLEMEGQKYLSLSQLAAGVLRRLHVPFASTVATFVVQSVFGVVTLFYLLQYVRSPARDTLTQAVLAVMCAATFAAVGHLWPWFTAWLLGPAALVGKGPLWRLTLATALVAPFANILWLASSGWSVLPLAGAVFFSAIFAVAMCPLDWRRVAWGE